jgi:outer membrane immunogenic protein
MRRIVISLLGASAMVAGATYGALAADLGVPAVRVAPAPVVVAPFTWTGFYLGANAGGGWSNGHGNATINGTGTGAVTGSGSGFLGGGQAGYNWQWGSWVVGAETDLQGSTGKGNVTGTIGAVTLNASSKSPYFGTIRARAGYAIDRWLIYVTGGAVYGSNQLSGTISNTPGTFSSSATFWTYTIGGGVEAALWDPHWSVKAEYLYMGAPSKGPIVPTIASATGTVSGNVVRAGFNYRF